MYNMGVAKVKKKSEPNKESSDQKKPKKSSFSRRNRVFVISLSALGLALCLISIGIGGYIFFQDRIYPGITVAGVSLAGETVSEATQKLNQVLASRTETPLVFNFQSQVFQIKIDPQSINNQPLAENAFAVNHHYLATLPNQIEITNLSLNIDSQIKTIASNIDLPAIDSQLTSTPDLDITVSPSQNGQILDQDKLKQELVTYLNGGPIPNSTLPTKIDRPTLSYDDALAIKNALLKIKASPLKLVYKDQTFTIDLPTALNLIDLKNSQSVVASGNFYGHQITIESISTPQSQINNVQLSFNPQKLNDYLTNTVASKIDRPVKEPLFNFDGQKVTQFQPPQQGLALDKAQTTILINQIFLANNSVSTINLPVTVTEAKNQLSNQLGIKELIGEGVSNFDHSIPNRIYNVQLAASRINGSLIGPGQTFSFVNTVGDISGASGYKQAYVIKEGRTVLDDGGGVCQVSTTLFRAVLNSGLPVVERTAHAYRVGYYEEGFPPGIDATIFSPTVDFKFKNDTQNSILIQTRIEGLTLYVDFYGTSDGRVAVVSNPVVTNQTPPPPDLRQDDPTLPKGTVKQVDFSAWGANVVFSRTVTRNGQVIINDTYHSNYKAWQAIYLVGTGA